MSNEFTIGSNNEISVNLRENMLLEASAGTGKTYSLERIVLNLIKDENYNLSIKDILVVTFTNKATREMKERIRKILIKDYREESDLLIRKKLEKAIGEFDEASIYTIHGFCQNTLKAYPFESFSLFNQEINRDSSILESSVWNFLRDFEQSADELSLKEFFCFRGNKSFKSVVSELIKLYNREEFKGECQFFPGKEDRDFIYKIASEFNSKSGELYKQVSNFKIYSSEILASASKAMGSRTKMSSFDAIVNGFAGIDEGFDFIEFMEHFYSSGLCKNLIKLTSEFLQEKNKKGLTVHDIDTTSREIINNADMLFSCLELLFDKENVKKNPMEQFLSGEFIKKALNGIDRCFKKSQESLGVLSYNDLIDNLYKRVVESSDQSLVYALRKKYKIALIDEFQDTDKKQWGIFNRLFGETPNHNFILIGDPKQSIYGFRGADLEIYYKAKASVLECNRYFLGTNFRSENGIVEGVNRVFSSVFGVKSGGNTASTDFSPVKSSNKPSKFPQESGRNIEFLLYDRDVKKDEIINMSQCKKGYFSTIVKKILHLLNSNNIDPGEIAILVDNHNDSVILRDRLLKKSVPVVISKQKNVYKSNEAEDILALLKAIQRPGSQGDVKRVLLSPLFAFSLKEIHNMESLGELELISEKLMAWSNKMQHSGLISIWREVEDYSPKGNLQTRLLESVNGERAYTNYKHLIENLNVMQKNERLNVQTLYQRLHRLIETTEDDEENSVRLDKDSKAVQIMTIHASKGLEFSIVFFAGGFSGNRERSSDYGTKYAQKEGLWTFDFLSLSNSKFLSQKDEWEERKRLYYVAFTRAVSKLYLPLFKNSEVFEINSLYSSLNWSETVGRIDEIAGEAVKKCEQPIHKHLTIDNPSLLKKVKLALPLKNYEDIKSSGFFIDEEIYLLEAEENYQGHNAEEQLTLKQIESKTGFKDRYIWVSSYSGLTKDSHGSTSKQDADREDDEEEVAIEYKKSDELNNFNIPGGATFGDFIHEFFEEIDFSKYELTLEEFLLDSEINDLCLAGAKKFFDMDWFNKSHKVAKKVIWSVLNTKLNLLGSSIPIGAFNDKERIHEREFYFRIDKKNVFEINNLELKVEKGFLKGFIDLIFIYNETLFIADWKSTTIKGPEEFSNYSSERVEASMIEHNYHLQGLIYTVALYLHLHKTKPDFNYSKDIGGYFYFYVRGMSPDSQNGISFYKPLESEVKGFIGKMGIEL